MGKPRIKVSAHSLIMREAASTGQLKDKPVKLTKRQREMLAYLAGSQIGRGSAEGIRENITAESLARRGLIDLGVSSDMEITDAGRTALQEERKCQS